MTVKNIVLHIGLSKTGTSSIQNYIRDSLAQLRTLGVSALIDNDWPHGLAKAINASDEAFKDKFKESLKSEESENLIISSEYFEFMDEAKVRAVKSFLCDYQVTVVVYLKRQDKAIISMYNEEVKKGITLLDFREYCRQNWRRFDYCSLLQKWSTAFGVENMVVRPFDVNSFYNEDLLQDFFVLLVLISSQK
ncbi:hypothetical protein [Shewanella phaeophyticola]|uniref:Sulfotransferase family protein n=1 Tax=Shewanella phaeophyticola TaxID=2978345 RepID=A0ABT2NZD3_9GAMM|nr:hypothetical protein [Shewanella sp. KJ10-1]MCT8985740.1 hypothetical protein [Shewanella sp. KJ10-1]